MHFRYRESNIFFPRSLSTNFIKARQLQLPHKIQPLTPPPLLSTSISPPQPPLPLLSNNNRPPRNPTPHKRRPRKTPNRPILHMFITKPHARLPNFYRVRRASYPGCVEGTFTPFPFPLLFPFPASCLFLILCLFLIIFFPGIRIRVTARGSLAELLAIYHAV